MDILKQRCLIGNFNEKYFKLTQKFYHVFHLGGGGHAMTDERLTGLALMYIHPEIDIDPHRHTVVDRFASPPVNRTCAENVETKRPCLLL